MSRQRNRSAHASPPGEARTAPRAGRPRHASPLRLLLCFVAALGLHLPAVGLLLLLQWLRPLLSPAEVPYTAVELQPSEEASLALLFPPEGPAPAATAPAPPAPPPPEPVIERPPPVEKLTGQVVELTRPERPSPPPPEARYLAEFDSAVEKQTRKLGKPGRPKPAPAVPATPEERNRLPPPSPAAPAPSAPPPPPETTALPPPEPPPVAPAEPLGPGSLALPELAVPSLVPPAPSPRRERALALPPGPLSPRVGSYEELLPPLFGPAGPAVPDGPVGDLGSDDYLPDLPEGDRLSLNAREFKYWSFFQRVRENLRQHWRPGDKFQRRDPWGKVYGVKDRLTVLSVTLDPSGKIQELTLVKPSGVDFLDDEALDAFRAAARFPNPPPGLVEADGLIRFTFGFAVVRNTGDFQLFRYRF